MEQIHQLVSRNQLEQAIQILVNESVDSALNGEAVLLQGQLSQLKRNQRMGVISYAQGNMEQNKISMAILDLGKAIKDEKTISRPSSTASNDPIITENLASATTKILFLAANPFDTGRLRLDKEFREIDDALKRAKKRDTFDLISKFAVRPRDLRNALLENEPNIIHFSGHGLADKMTSNPADSRGIVINKKIEEASGGIILENDQGESHAVNGTALASIIELFATNIQVVILNSCYSESQAKMIIEHVPYVIGMNQAVDDSTAIIFATSFYDAIGVGRGIDFAFKFAKASINLENLKGAAIPQLLRNENIGQ